MASRLPFWLLQWAIVASVCRPFVPNARTARLSFEFKLGQGDPLRDGAGLRPSTHPETINAIAHALHVRAQNISDMPLRMNENTEPFEITLTAGKIAQEAVRTQQEMSGDDSMTFTQEEQQILAGRIIAVVTRLGDLEPELHERCKEVEWVSKQNKWDSFGVLEDETSESEIDSMILDKPSLRVNRAECLLALFLETIEGPGLRLNDVTVPCMNVDFLDSDRHTALFSGSKETEDAQTVEVKENGEHVKATGDPLSGTTDVRPSLHPVAIDAIAEALKIRAHNKTTYPLRQFKDDIELFEIQLAAGKIAEQALAKRQKSSEDDSTRLNDDEASTVGGRIVAVIMRFEDLEWELNHRARKEMWISKYNEWHTFGLLENESCTRTLDKFILSDPLFTTNRAKHLLAILLLNLEGPGVKACGATVPGGSDADFLEEDHYKLMMPKQVSKVASS